MLRGDSSSDTWRWDISSTANAVKVFTYDLASAGLQPPLSAFAWDSAACQDCPLTFKPGGNRNDFCNNAFGRPLARTFAAPYQGHVWAHHGQGVSVAPLVHARLAFGNRTVASPTEADLMFIPLYAVESCTVNGAHYRECGIDFQVRRGKRCCQRSHAMPPGPKATAGAAV